MATNPTITAENTFAQGLIMDLAPDNTQNTHLTSALNATFITHNGNEFSLQNDMGNGRVDTAYLPDGYIPIGSCEFGGIIYIVSYNPLTNKSQVGSFPSPERNVSVSGTSIDPPAIKVSDLIEATYDEENQSWSGTLITNSKQYIIYNNTLSPGDLYHIMSDDKKLDFIDFNVISLDESGKMTDLGELKNFDTIETDYDTKWKEKYTVFESKIPGKLGILAKLHTLTGFDCTYTIKKIDADTITEDDPLYQANNMDSYNFYEVTLNPSWDNEYAPTKLQITYNTSPIEVTNPNHTYGKTTLPICPAEYKTELSAESGQVLVRFGLLKRGENEDCPSIIHSYTVTPVMQYDLPDDAGNSTPVFVAISDQQISGQIQVDKIGTGTVNLTDWHYYNTETTSTLTLGIEAYPEPNYTVEGIDLQFYDALGQAAVYSISNRDSYSGTFTETLPLQGSYTSNNMPKTGKHKGEEIDQASYNSLSENDRYTETIDGVEHYYKNDFGTLYYGLPYAVVIEVKYTQTGGDTSNYKYFYRWLWTNTVFNEWYYNTRDFDDLNIMLGVSTIPQWSGSENLKYNTVTYEQEYRAGVGAKVSQIYGKVNLQLRPTLVENYGCFVLNDDIINRVKVSLGEDTNFKASITYSKEQDTSDISSNGASCTCSDTLLELLGRSTTGSSTEEIWNKSDNYNDYGNLSTTSEMQLSASSAINNTFNIDLLQFSKYKRVGKEVTATLPQLLPALYTKDDLTNVGLTYSDSNLYLTDSIGMYMWSSGDSHTMLRWYIDTFDSATKGHICEANYDYGVTVGNNKTISSCFKEGNHSGTPISEVVGDVPLSFFLLHFVGEQESSGTVGNTFTEQDKQQLYLSRPRLQATYSKDLYAEEYNYLSLANLSNKNHKTLYILCNTDTEGQIHMLNNGFLSTASTLGSSKYSIEQSTEVRAEHEYNSADGRKYFDIYWRNPMEGDTVTGAGDTLVFVTRITGDKAASYSPPKWNTSWTYPKSGLMGLYSVGANEQLTINGVPFTDTVKGREIASNASGKIVVGSNAIQHYKYTVELGLDGTTIIANSGWVSGKEVYSVNATTTVTIGNLLASLLMTVYVAKNDASVSYTSISDTQCPDDYSAEYSFPVKVTMSDSVTEQSYTNCAKGINLGAELTYSNYLTELSKVNDQQGHNILNEFNTHNLTIKIDTIEQDIPLQLNMDYQDPDNLSDTPNVVIKGTPKYVPDFNSSSLFDSDGKLLNGAHTFTYYQTIKLDSNGFSPSDKISTVSISGLNDILKNVKGRIYMKRDTYEPDYAEFGYYHKNEGVGWGDHNPNEQILPNKRLIQYGDNE